MVPHWLQNLMPGTKSALQLLQLLLCCTSVIALPHSLQNLLASVTFKLHPLHALSAGGSILLPHSLQNFLSADTTVPHEQVMLDMLLAAGGATIGVPQLLQNFLPASFIKPQPQATPPATGTAAWFGLSMFPPCRLFLPKNEPTNS